MLVAIVILVIVGAVNIWLGYAIKYQRRYRLIAGYDATRDGEPVALARWLGNGGFALASRGARSCSKPGRAES